jgi:hypothetical protein
LFDEDGKATFVCGRQLLFDEQTAFADVWRVLQTNYYLWCILKTDREKRWLRSDVGRVLHSLSIVSGILKVVDACREKRWLRSDVWIVLQTLFSVIVSGVWKFLDAYGVDRENVFGHDCWCLKGFSNPLFPVIEWCFITGCGRVWIDREGYDLMFEEFCKHIVPCQLWVTYERFWTLWSWQRKKIWTRFLMFEGFFKPIVPCHWVVYYRLWTHMEFDREKRWSRCLCLEGFANAPFPVIVSVSVGK